MATPEWKVTLQEAGTRLDVFLAQHVEPLSRSAASRALKKGEVHVVGKKSLKPGLLLRTGDRVAYHPTGLAEIAETRPENLPLVILYQDKFLAIINKPAGLVMHPAAGHWNGTLVNALLYHLPDLTGIGGVKRPGIVHRLDKETSGLLLVAKNDKAHQILTASIQKREVERVYDALVWGEVLDNSFSVITQLGRDPRNRKRFAVVRSGGKRAVTHIQVGKRFKHFTLLRVKLETGRTHQIRIHSHYAGFPVVGDRVYGGRGEAGKLQKLGMPRPARQLLHAGQLRFQHPAGGKNMFFQAPWPEDFREFVNLLEPAI